MRVAVAVRVACALLWVGIALTACDTDAVGVEDCRDIERARCEAARFCDVRIETDEDVAACNRFARDNCLHGLEVDDTPSTTELNRCVDVINAAGACAQKTGPDTLASDCVPANGLQNVRGWTTCEVVHTPEVAPQCQFLVAEPPEPPDAGDTTSEPDASEPDAGQGDGG